MRHLFRSLMILVSLATLVVAGCSQAASAPTATKAADPTKAPALAQPSVAPAAPPTVAPVAPPTAAPAKAVDYPQKGRSVSFIVAYAAGGVNDLGARILAAGLEKQLGSPFEVVNKVGAGGQIGLTDMARSKPDGYTISTISIPSTMAIYLDPQRESLFARKDFAIVAGSFQDPEVVSVKADSPYQTLKDLVDAAKAKPDTITVAVGTLNSSIELAIGMLEKVTGAKFRRVHTDGGAQNVTTLLGGHVDASFNNSTEIRQAFQGGSVRTLAIASQDPSPFFPGVKTMVSQGYNVVFSVDQGVGASVGTPKEVLQILSDALKKTLDTDQTKTAMSNVGVVPLYRDAQSFGATWDQMEPLVKSVMDLTTKP